MGGERYLALESIGESEAPAELFGAPQEPRPHVYACEPRKTYSNAFANRSVSQRVAIQLARVCAVQRLAVGSRGAGWVTYFETRG